MGSAETATANRGSRDWTAMPQLRAVWQTFYVTFINRSHHRTWEKTDLMFPWKSRGSHGVIKQSCLSIWRMWSITIGPFLQHGDHIPEGAEADLVYAICFVQAILPERQTTQHYRPSTCGDHQKPTKQFEQLICTVKLLRHLLFE